MCELPLCSKVTEDSPGVPAEGLSSGCEQDPLRKIIKIQSPDIHLTSIFSAPITAFG